MLALKKDKDMYVIEVNLPQGKTQEQLIEELEREISAIERHLYGKRVGIFGRITTGMAMYLGHRLAHICKEVLIFDPKENKYISVIKH